MNLSILNATTSLTAIESYNYLYPFVETNRISTHPYKRQTNKELYSVPVIYDSFKEKLAKIHLLPDNWDGYGAVSPDFVVYSNACCFLEKLDNKIMKFLEEDNILSTPYGTITFDFYVNDDLISVEIGKIQIGFFTDCTSGENMESKGEKLSLYKLPDSLVVAFKRLLENA